MHYMRSMGLQYRRNSYIHARLTCIYMNFQEFTCINTNLRALHEKLVHMPFHYIAILFVITFHYITV